MYTKKELISIVKNNSPLDPDRLLQYLKNNLHKTAELFLFEIFDSQNIKLEFEKTLNGLIRIDLIYDYVIVDPKLVDCNLSVDIAVRFVNKSVHCNHEYSGPDHSLCEVIKMGEWVYLPIKIEIVNE